MGPLYAVECLQEVKVTFQNKLMLHRTQINEELSNWIAKPVRSHSKAPVSDEREIELGNDINLNLLLTLLGYIFQLQDYPADGNFLQAALVAFFSHAPQPQPRSLDLGPRNELKTSQVDLGNDGANVSKMIDTLTLTNHPCWIAFSGHSTTSSPKWKASGSFCLITDLRQRILHPPSGPSNVSTPQLVREWAGA